ncbi:UNVERIFIED_CONTAM: hypothetical protein Slati_4430000 [Sesamum latifolium]|uniref:Uncharacterized protein n=1 Tax=Sesamum latifolium TaxID=2727402 RepID=A0AAW2SS22_9LAMI
MLMYFATRARSASNLKAGFLARDLKKSPSESPCEKALAFTSCVAEGTSSAAALNLCSPSEDARGGRAIVEALPEVLVGGLPVFCLLVAWEPGLLPLPLPLRPLRQTTWLLEEEPWRLLVL